MARTLLTVFKSAQTKAAKRAYNKEGMGARLPEDASVINPTFFYSPVASFVYPPTLLQPRLCYDLHKVFPKGRCVKDLVTSLWRYWKVVELLRSGA
jgi:hypothetical protein